ncbi:MAG: pyridoxamine 5'-phosphate oxidase family protein [Bacteroidota bacterium]|nr:pyridoxamine 5'-phosphate oxidase family protein [Bacteroidota bacterium]MDP4192875.1 pyridoxamine 5'-phosphate oxidase family protein [Bacteroidota bacterium]MDP4195796.1 pyridoxamine 5'-phosphate oxidase family protein [Bacteroidota bacterium]
METQTQRNELKKLWEKVKDIKVAMMTTHESNGSLRSRPMYTQEREFDGNIWFFTKDDSPKIAEINKDAQINLSYADLDEDTYVSVSGTAQVVKNKEKTKELWNPALKAWFPKGIDDPHLALIKINVDYAEYWDAHSGKMVQLLGMTKSVLEGKEYRPGENRKLNF